MQAQPREAQLRHSHHPRCTVALVEPQMLSGRPHASREGR